jgi:hypothetical protein
MAAWLLDPLNLSMFWCWLVRGVHRATWLATTKAVVDRSYTRGLTAMRDYGG